MMDLSCSFAGSAIGDTRNLWQAREQREMLRYEASILDNILNTYAEHAQHTLQCTPVKLNEILQTYSEPPQVRDILPVLSPLAHHDILEDENCGCKICLEWANRRRDLTVALKLQPRGHKNNTCGCMTCRFIGRARMNLVAAANKRDLLIGMAYHARHHSRYPLSVMSWVEQELGKASYTTMWSATEMGRYPVSYWLRKCEVEISPRLSGTVFQMDNAIV